MLQAYISSPGVTWGIDIEYSFSPSVTWGIDIEYSLSAAKYDALKCSSPDSCATRIKYTMVRKWVPCVLRMLCSYDVNGCLVF